MPTRLRAKNISRSPFCSFALFRKNVPFRPSLYLKTQDSAGVITVDAEVIAELREFLPHSQSPFILASVRPPRNDSARTYYRCERIFDRLNAWLHAKGVTANKPLHELRKEIGAQIATHHGIYAASRFLRHSDITTTARHYAEHKTPSRLAWASCGIQPSSPLR